MLKKGASCADISRETMERIQLVSDEPQNGSTDSRKTTVPRPQPRKVENPVKFDRIAVEELANALGVDDKWNELAVLLDLEDFSETWSSTKNPTKCLLDMVQDSQTYDVEQISSLLQTLGINDAIHAIDSMVARQYKDY